MKKLFIVAAILLLPMFASASFDASLKYGARGQDVVELQEFLIDNGCLAGQATGNFYSLTLKAVKCFQSKNNLPSTGYFGPMSRAVASTILAKDLVQSSAQEIAETGTTSPVLTVSGCSSTTGFSPLTGQPCSGVQKNVQQLLTQIVTNTTPATTTTATPALNQAQTPTTLTSNSSLTQQSNPSPIPTPTPIPQPTVVQPPKFTSEPRVLSSGTSISNKWAVAFAVEFENVSYAAVNCSGGNYPDGFWYGKAIPTGSPTTLSVNNNNLIPGDYVCTFYLNTNSSISAGIAPVVAKDSGGNPITKKLNFTVPLGLVLDVTTDKSEIANDGVESLTLTVVTKKSDGTVWPNKTVQIGASDASATVTSDSSGLISYIYKSSTAGSRVIAVSADGIQAIKTINVINIYAEMPYWELINGGFERVSAPAINEGVFGYQFSRYFPSGLTNLVLNSIRFRLTGIDSTWIKNIKITKDEVDDRQDVSPPRIIPSTYTFDQNGYVEIVPTSPVDIYFNDRVNVVLDIDDASGASPGTVALLKTFDLILDANNVTFGGTIGGRKAILTPKNTGGNVLPARQTTNVYQNYCWYSNFTILKKCFDI